MKATLCAILLLALPSSLLAQADPADEATAVFDSFLTSLTNVDLDAVVDLFWEDALFWGTGSQSLVESPAGVRQYFSAISDQEPGQTIASALDYSVKVMSESMVLVSGMWEVTPAGNSTGTPLRVSMVLSLRDGQWKILQFHNSNVPG